MANLPALPALEQFNLKEVGITDFELGRGSHTNVLELEYRGLKCTGYRNLHEIDMTHVAQMYLEKCQRFECKGKKLHQVLQEVEEKYFSQKYFEECRLLDQVRHPNIVQFLGICFEKGSRIPIIVNEYLPANLTKFLDHYGILPNEISYSLLHDVSLGLAYLHGQSPPIIHGNLTANNVYLSTYMTAKISNVGIVQVFNQTPTKMIQTSKTHRIGDYMPSEVVVADPHYDSSVDVFSFGVMIVHIFTAKWPLSLDSTNPTFATEVRECDDLLEKIPQDHPMIDFIRSCLHSNPQKRLQAEEIAGRMKDMVHQFPPSFENKVEMLQHIRTECHLIQELNPRIKVQKELTKNEQCNELSYPKVIQLLEQQNKALQLEIEKSQTELRSFEEQCKELSTAVERKAVTINLLQEEMGRVNELKHKIAIEKSNIIAQEEQERLKIRTKMGKIACKDSVISARNDCLSKCDAVVNVLTEQLKHTRLFLLQQLQPVPVQLSYSHCREAPVKMHSGQAISINGFIYYGGGFCNKENNTFYIYCYDPSRDFWTTLPKVSVQYFGVGEIKSQLVIVGGITKGTSITSTVIQTYTKGGWKHTLPSMHTPRCTPAVISLPAHLIVAGGYLGDVSRQITAKVEVYNSSTNQWNETDSLPCARNMLQQATHNNTIYLLGGCTEKEHCSEVFIAQVNKLISDSVSSSQKGDSAWKEIVNTPYYQSSVGNALNTLFAVGGVEECPGKLNPSPGVCAYSSLMNSWVYAGTLPSPVVNSTIVSISQTELLVMGGKNKESYYLPTAYKLTFTPKI